MHALRTSSYLSMKKLLLLSAVLVGAASASQAGGIHFGLSFPLPTPPRVVISRPAPVVIAPGDCYTAQAMVTSPACEPQVVVTPPVCESQVVVRDDCYPQRYAYHDRTRFVSDRSWNRHARNRR